MAKLSRCQLLRLFLTWNTKSSVIFNNLIFGTFDYMRAELEMVHNGEQFWINSFDNSKIDCMIIPSALKNDSDQVFDELGSRSEANSSMANTSSQRGGSVAGPLDSLNTFRNSSKKRRQSIDNLSTNFVLFCNPNACFYEFINYQSEWLQYYT